MLCVKMLLHWQKYLGIIGVVAAMTLPVLVGNYQKTVWVNQLKKSVNTFEVGMKKLLFDEEVDDLSYIPMFNIDTCYNNGGDVALGESTLKKYFKIIKYSYDSEKAFTWTALDSALGTDNNEDLAYVYLNDGSKFGIDACFDNSWYVAAVYFDVNGDKNPNKMGRDIFAFRLRSQGNLVPVAGQFQESQDGEYWKTASSNIYKCTTQNSWGEGCAARIIENGWKMDY